MCSWQGGTGGRTPAPPAATVASAYLQLGGTGCPPVACASGAHAAFAVSHNQGQQRRRQLFDCRSRGALRSNRARMAEAKPAAAPAAWEGGELLFAGGTDWAKASAACYRHQRAMPARLGPGKALRSRCFLLPAAGTHWRQDRAGEGGEGTAFSAPRSPVRGLPCDQPPNAVQAELLRQEKYPNLMAPTRLKALMVRARPRPCTRIDLPPAGAVLPQASAPCPSRCAGREDSFHRSGMHGSPLHRR